MYKEQSAGGDKKSNNQTIGCHLPHSKQKTERPKWGKSLGMKANILSFLKIPLWRNHNKTWAISNHVPLIIFIFMLELKDSGKTLIHFTA